MGRKPVGAVRGAGHNAAMDFWSVDAHARFQALFEHTNDAVFILDLEGKHRAANKRACEMLGYTLDELIGQGMELVVAPESVAAAYNRLEQLRSGTQLPIYERTFYRKDGTRLAVEVNVSMVRDETGEGQYIQSVVRDISERKREEQTLQLLVDGISDLTGRALISRATRYLATTIKTKGAIVAELDVNRPNRAKNVTTWWDGDEIEEPFEFPTAIDNPPAPDASDLVFVGSRFADTYPDFELAQRLGIESCMTIALSANSQNVIGLLSVFDTDPMAFDDRNERILRIFASRICAELYRFRTEEALLQSRHLESVGQLAGGIAHDFNNMLMSALGNVSLAKLDADPGLHDTLEEIERSILRTRNLSRQLMSLASGGAPIKEPTELGPLLEEFVALTLRGTNIEPTVNISNQLSTISADPGQIGQVIANLVLNSAQAMPDGGELVIDVENREIGHFDKPPLTPGTYAVLSVRDTGPGIEPEHLPRVFDPYYTTKPTGTGLGLATSYSIVKNHDGHIEIESTPGAGTRCIVYLPVADTSHADSRAERPAGKILVMDDDESVQTIIALLLEKLGYAVQIADDGQRALDLYEAAMKDVSRFDAVLLDITVPGGMGGLETLKRLTQIDPTVVGIVSSGYSEDPVMSQYKEFGFTECLAKPYRLDDLKLTLESALGG